MKPAAFTLSGRAISLIAIAGLLIAGNYATAERVVCVGDDGHVSVEDAVGGFCSDESSNDASRATREELVGAERSTHCGPCEDLPIFAGNHSLHSSRESINKTMACRVPVMRTPDLQSMFVESCAVHSAANFHRGKSLSLILRNTSLQL